MNDLEAFQSREDSKYKSSLGEHSHAVGHIIGVKRTRGTKVLFRFGRDITSRQTFDIIY